MITVITKYLIFENCDYDLSPHKMIALFLRIAIMIVVLIKCTIYEDCDHDRNPHKNVIFWVYMIVIMITVLFIRTATMIAVFTKMSCTWVFKMTAIMVVVLTKCSIFEFLWRLRPWSWSSQNALFSESVLTEDCDYESRSSCQHHHHQ